MEEILMKQTAFTRRASLALAGSALSLMPLNLPRGAQSCPKQTITMVVPFAPGGSPDVVARVVAQKMSEILSQQVVVENVAGAGGNLGADRVARAEPDGYTILMGTVATH